MFFFLLFIGHHQSADLIWLRYPFVKTTESYEVSLAIIYRQTSYESGIFRQYYGIIHGSPIKYTRFADWVAIWVVYLPERTETAEPNYRIGPDCAGRAYLQ